MSKTVTQSKTMITGIATTVSSITALILHFTGVAVLDPAVLGATISALISGVIFTILRLKTSEPIKSADTPPPPAANVLLMMVMLVTLAGLTGCVRTFQAKKSVKVNIIKDPCKVQVFSDGELVFKLTGKLKCGVNQ